MKKEWDLTSWLVYAFLDYFVVHFEVTVWTNSTELRCQQNHMLEFWNKINRDCVAI